MSSVSPSPSHAHSFPKGQEVQRVPNVVDRIDELSDLENPTYHKSYLESRETYAYHLIRNFVTTSELDQLRQIIDEKYNLFTHTSGLGNLGPRYSVIDGDQIRSQLPELLDYGEERVRPAVQEFASRPLRLMASTKRSMRIQRYQLRREGFRWHFDGHAYVALLTLKNTLRGETQVVSPKLSSVLRYLPSIFYTVPRLLDLLPHWSVVSRERDLLLMNGSRVLHRGVSLGRHGDRVLLVYAYDETGKTANPILDKIARRINY
jgi:hypothetical protein